MNRLRYLIYTILLLVFSSIVFYNLQKPDKETLLLLNNNVVFEGKITKIQKSNNHAFGIITLLHLKSSVNEFSKKAKSGIYPYRISNNLIELYCTVSVDRKIGDLIRVISKDFTIYYNPQNSNEKGSLYVINDSYNIGYVKENTQFK